MKQLYFPKNFFHFAARCCVVAVYFLGMLQLAFATDSILEHSVALAKKGDVNSQKWLGYQFLTGGHVSINMAEGLKWLTAAANQGDVDTQLQLGRIRYEGFFGVPQDYAEARKWFRLAAEKSNSSAQGDLGLMYYFGEGVPQDYLVAGHWYALGAEGGDFNAQLGLGRMYLSGNGFARDEIEGYKWLLIAHATATRENDTAGAQVVDSIMKDQNLFVSPQQMDQANRRATAWWTIHEK